MAVTSTGLKMLFDPRLKKMLRELTQEMESKFCPVCGWKHDGDFFEITIPGEKTIELPEVPARLVKLVHSALEQGTKRIEVKSDAVSNVCGGYQHPCKVFGDLGKKREYKLLFTRSRGFIALRRVPALPSPSQSIRNDLSQRNAQSLVA